MDRQPADWTERAPRRGISLTGLAVREDGQSRRVLVSNLSYQGCHLWSDAEFEVGETLQITLPQKGELAAQVRWSKDGRVGLRFLTGQSASDERRARLGV